MKDLLIGGEWREPAAGGQREIRCPADGRLVATVAEAGRGVLPRTRSAAFSASIITGA